MFRTYDAPEITKYLKKVATSNLSQSGLEELEFLSMRHTLDTLGKKDEIHRLYAETEREYDRRRLTPERELRGKQCFDLTKKDLKRLSEIKTELGEEIKKVKAALIELCDWQEGKCLFQRQRGSAYTCCTTTFVCKQLDEDKGCTLDDEERPLLCDLFLCVPAIEALMEKVKAFNSGDDSVREELDFLKDYIKMCILLNKEQLPIYKEYFDATVIRECKNPCAKKCTKPYLKSAEVVGTGEFF